MTHKKTEIHKQPHGKRIWIYYWEPLTNSTHLDFTNGLMCKKIIYEFYNDIQMEDFFIFSNNTDNKKVIILFIIYL